MKKFNVSGMTCAACSARVERAVSAVSGVESCSVNLLLGTLSVEGKADDSAIISAVRGAGYGIKTENDKTVKPKESKVNFKGRLISSIILLIILMYVSMGHIMWGWYLPVSLAENPMALGLIQLLLTTAVMVINQKFFISGFKGIVNCASNMDTLVALGSGAAYGYSIFMLLKMSQEMLLGNPAQAFHYLHNLYFESAAMILTLITVGKMLEAYSKGKTTSAIEGLIKLTPKTATVIYDGKEIVIEASKLLVGDEFVVRPGESIPADAIVIDGSSAVDEAALTGESIPAHKEQGSTIYASTINTSGFLKCKATKVGGDTVLAEIIKMVSDAAGSKAPIARLADKVSGVFVPFVIIVALITLIAWLVSGADFGFAIARSISVLVISCPCALGLATPVAIMVGNGVAAKNGILFKTATALETAGKVNTVVLDKTGTITEGKPKVTDVIVADGVNLDELLEIAASIESKSEHPLSKAITEYCKDKDISYKQVTEFNAISGSGVKAKLNDSTIAAGNLKFISEIGVVDQKLTDKAALLSEQGKTPLFFIKDKNLFGVIAVADTIKKDSKSTVSNLKKLGIKVVMLTGDNLKTANSIAKEAGIDNVIAEVLPSGKQQVVEDASKFGMVAMVGDGINDAPALTTADVGIAIGAGTDIAIDSADVVLVKSSLKDVVKAIKISRATLRNIKENLFWAFIYNIIGIPVAAGVFINLLGLELNPMFAAAAMSLSSFCVVTNALRLNLFKLNKKEKSKMQKTVKIQGMMCPHCEARVKEILSALPEVDVADVSHKEGMAVLTLNADLSDETIKSIIENAGYKVL